MSAVVVGTDRTAANGDVANKICTYQIAVLAKRHPRYSKSLVRTAQRLANSRR